MDAERAVGLQMGAVALALQFTTATAGVAVGVPPLVAIAAGTAVGLMSPRPATPETESEED